MIIRLSVSNNRKLFGFISFWLIIYESNSKLKLEYSYFQYHWWPIVLIEINGLLVSSNKYKSFKDGKAINNKIIPGTIVQIISIVCPDNKK